MDVHINFWGVLLAGVSSMIIGALYYADSVFGRQWKQLSKIDQKRFDKEFPRTAPWLFLAALLTAYIMAHVMFLARAFYGYSWMATGVTTGLWLWLGISATTLFIHNALEQRPSQLTIISVGNRFLSLMAMGLILGWVHP